MTNLGPGRDKLLMRGLSDGAFTGRTRSTVGTYLDDTPINYNAPNPDLRLVDVERVETLRGPQGALYGSGALSGVYRVVANKPDPSTLAAAIIGASAWTKGGSPSREIEGFFNAPLVEDRAAVRAVAYYDLQGGYLDNVALRLSNVDSTTRVGGRLAVRAQLNDAWRVDVSTAIQRLRSRDAQYTSMDAQHTTAGLTASQRARGTRETHDNDFALGTVSVQGDLGFANLASSTSYIRHDFASQYDATGPSSDILKIFDVPANAVGVYSERTRSRRFVQDLVLTSAQQGKFRWLAGAYASASLERTPSFLLVSRTLRSQAALARVQPASQKSRQRRPSARTARQSPRGLSRSTTRTVATGCGTSPSTARSATASRTAGPPRPAAGSSRPT